MQSIINLIKNDHKNVQGLFEKFRRLTAPKERYTVGTQIIKQLSIHASAEEEVLYPAIRNFTPDGYRIADHSTNEHQTVKELLYKADNMDVNDPNYVSIMLKAIEDTDHHIKEEEMDILPKFEKSVSPQTLDDLSKQFERAKDTAPTRPHPAAPNKPPFNIPLNMGTAPIDKLRDTLEGRK